MARGANTVCVAVCGWELRVLRMVEGCTRPRCCVVATLAGSGEKLWLSRVAGIGRVVVVGLMATDAGSGKSGVVVVDMAIRADARRHQVRTCKGEGRVVVIESGVGPDARIVAQLARCRESGCGVCRVVRPRVVLLMARIAESAIQRVIVADVAIRAKPRRDGVAAG